MPELNIRPKSLMSGLSSIDTRSRTADNIKMLPLDKLDHFENHPFNLYTREALSELAESIKEIGIINPITVRPRMTGRYEILSGHNRSEAARLAGLKEIQAKIVELNDEQATLLVVDANLKQRPVILPSEKAKAYKMQLEAISHQGKRQGFINEVRNFSGKENDDVTCGHDDHNKKSRDIIAQMNNVSARQISRYIRLNYLLPELLEMADNQEIALLPAVEISYLTDDEQLQLYEILSEKSNLISMEAAKGLRERSGSLNKDKIESVLANKKEASEQGTKSKQTSFYKQISSGFTKYIKSKEKQGFDIAGIDEVIMTALETYFNEKRCL